MSDTPVVFQYQRALDEFRREGREPPLLKRMSELISLLDLTTTLGSALTREEILNAALLIVMGELQAFCGVLFVRDDAGGFRVKAARGLPPGAPGSVDASALPPAGLTRGAAGWPAAFDAFGLEVACPIAKGGKTIAILGLGRRGDARGYGEDEAAFLRSVAACAATPIENGLIYDELRTVNQKLSLKVFQLRNLFDISRELTASFDEEDIKSLVTTTLMGHLMVSRCAMYLRAGDGLALAHERGSRSAAETALVPAAEAQAVLGSLTSARGVADLPPGPLRERLLRGRMSLVVPLSLGGQGVEGFVAIGDRASGVAWSDEDRDFAFTLGRQAVAALETVRLHRIQLEKQRQDREMQIARDIQQSLFPSRLPVVPGFDVAAQSRSCYQVGGDHYDVIPLPGGRVALAIADVSGKGTPASILMASVHASLRALAGTMDAAALMTRLNAFLFENTQANRYVTLFYGELDPARRTLVYVNAGHVPPYRVARDGSATRLDAGGPVVGLLEGAGYETASVELDRDDVVAMVTDGATEALSAADQEFGDASVVDAVRNARGSAHDVMTALVAAVDRWTGAAGCTDDLTVLVLKAL